MSLNQQGYEVAGPFSSVSETLLELPSLVLSAAILDMNGEMTFPVATVSRRLGRRLSGCRAIPDGSFPSVVEIARFSKPFLRKELLEAVGIHDPRACSIATPAGYGADWIRFRYLEPLVRGFLASGTALPTSDSSIVSALVVCCALPEYSEAMPLTDDGFDTGAELSLAIPPEQSLSTSFLLSEWYQDTGSGGFPENFTDEYRLIDEWERSPG